MSRAADNDNTWFLFIIKANLFYTIGTWLSQWRNVEALEVASCNLVTTIEKRSSHGCNQHKKNASGGHRLCQKSHPLVFFGAVKEEYTHRLQHIFWIRFKSVCMCVLTSASVVRHMRWRLVRTTRWGWGCSAAVKSLQRFLETGCIQLRLWTWVLTLKITKKRKKLFWKLIVQQKSVHGLTWQVWLGKWANDQSKKRSMTFDLKTKKHSIHVGLLLYQHIPIRLA